MEIYWKYRTFEKETIIISQKVGLTDRGAFLRASFLFSKIRCTTYGGWMNIVSSSTFLSTHHAVQTFLIHWPHTSWFCSQKMSIARRIYSEPSLNSTAILDTWLQYQRKSNRQYSGPIDCFFGPNIFNLLSKEGARGIFIYVFAHNLSRRNAG